MECVHFLLFTVYIIIRISLDIAGHRWTLLDKFSFFSAPAYFLDEELPEPSVDSRDLAVY